MYQCRDEDRVVQWRMAVLRAGGSWRRNKRMRVKRRLFGHPARARHRGERGDSALSAEMTEESGARRGGLLLASGIAAASGVGVRCVVFPYDALRSPCLLALALVTHDIAHSPVPVAPPGHLAAALDRFSQAGPPVSLCNSDNQEL